MKTNLTLALAALLLTGAAPSALAGDSGRTVCVLRQRPVAINSRPVCTTERPVVIARPKPVNRPVYNYGNGYFYPTAPPWKVPVVYGVANPRLHYVNPCVPNGYVGGIQNLPTNYVNIAPTFTRPAPACPAPRAAAPAGGR